MTVNARLTVYLTLEDGREVELGSVPFPQRLKIRREDIPDNAREIDVGLEVVVIDEDDGYPD